MSFESVPFSRHELHRRIELKRITLDRAGKGEDCNLLASKPILEASGLLCCEVQITSGTLVVRVVLEQVEEQTGGIMFECADVAAEASNRGP